MVRPALLLLFLSVRLLAGPLPESTVTSYYDAINKGDLVALEALMEPASYTMTVSAYALFKALEEPAFHRLIKAFDTDASARKAVESVVAEKLGRSRAKRVDAFDTVYLTPEKAVVHYLEDGRKKKLYLGCRGGVWLVDYKAGRPPSE